MFGHRHIMEALVTISAQQHQQYKLLILLLKGQKIELPPELVQAGNDLALKTQALQAALTQASEQKPKEK